MLSVQPGDERARESTQREEEGGVWEAWSRLFQPTLNRSRSGKMGNGCEAKKHNQTLLSSNSYLQEKQKEKLHEARIPHSKKKNKTLETKGT